MSAPKILDCTLRDGGFYNNWEFSDALVKNYISSIISTGIDVIELGYRSYETLPINARFANCSDQLIESLDLPSCIDYAIMLDAKNFVKSDNRVVSPLQKILLKKKSSPINIIRVAVNYTEVDLALPLVTRIAELGYRIFLNLMQVTPRDLDGLSQQCEKIKQAGVVEVIYFADSFGSMVPPDIFSVISTMRSSWGGCIGFHGHNNKGLALINAIEAIDNGASWIDSTVCGMGRGAGNVQTELLLKELGSDNGVVNVDSLHKLIREYFDPLKAQYKWGANVYYYLAAEQNIHPMYIQQLLSIKGLERSKILAAISILSVGNSSDYKKNIVSDFLSSKI